MTGYASIFVNLTNNTQAGAITFASMPFMTPGSGYNPGNYPPVFTNTVLDGATAQILSAGCQSIIVFNGNIAEQQGCPVTDGIAQFNLPGGDSLTISWELTALTPSNAPTINLSGDTYVITGTTPETTDNQNYTFNLTVTPQT